MSIMIVYKLTFYLPESVIEKIFYSLNNERFCQFPNVSQITCLFGLECVCYMTVIMTSKKIYINHFQNQGSTYFVTVLNPITEIMKLLYTVKSLYL